MVDERWDIARGDRDIQNHALLAAFVDPRFKNDAVWVPREIQRAEEGFIHICSRFKQSGPAGCNLDAVVSPPRSQASSGLVLRPRAADVYDDDSRDAVLLAWRAWMKEEVTVEGLSCDVRDWWGNQFSLLPVVVGHVGSPSVRIFAWRTWRTSQNGLLSNFDETYVLLHIRACDGGLWGLNWDASRGGTRIDWPCGDL